MVLGCSSDAGKSLVATALCRWFARRGVRVAPFKAQNMSNNARVVGPTGSGPGGEIGVAQWLQARAAGVEPDVRMNPVLVKPEADDRSQVVVLGAVDRELGARAWDDRHDALWRPMAESYDSLSAEFDLVVIEGAGSPAEINLRDQVNNRVIEHADASALLVADIDRGGAFAHLYGTWALVPDTTRQRLGAFVLNRFRGDASLLAPGPAELVRLTAMADAGVLPMLRHDLPREEGAAEGGGGHVPPGSPRVVLPRFPFGSNLDEMHLVTSVAEVTWASGPAPFADLDPTRDLIVLPGSKNVISDLDWMRQRGIAGAVTAATERGVRVVGICGGAMMLGREVRDPDGIEGAAAHREGLGSLDVATTMREPKRVVRAVVELGELEEPWSSLSGLSFDGYEIRHGDHRTGHRADRHGGPVVVSGHVLATMAHGALEDPRVVGALLGVTPTPVLDRTFELLADAVDEHLDGDLLRRLVDAPTG
ncbi:cobyric acid synthase [Ilumatobacter sp.]|uniref:cobyric acid synthase n=1 Tax=Ilumatobacter sp. TaxID=1967498 RepID=UPI003B52C7FA